MAIDNIVTYKNLKCPDKDLKCILASEIPKYVAINPLTDVTYSELVALIASSGLIAGSYYRITDFQTVHYIVPTSEITDLTSIITGENEPLVVLATSVNTLAKEVHSALFPDDIIYYDWNPANWLRDVSFSNVRTNSISPTIVTGWKGVIHFRHDTLRNNSTGYDFRNVRFRRWKTNVPTWLIGTTYARKTFVTYNGVIYCSIYDGNIGNLPTDADNWVKLMDIVENEYWCGSPSAHNIFYNTYITAGAEFDDFLTFTPLGDITYELGVRSTHFGQFVDNYDFDEDNSSILSNNVMFLVDNGYFASYDNSFGATTYGNTIMANDMRYNNFTKKFSYNLFCSDQMEENTFNDFTSNILYTSYSTTYDGDIGNCIFGGGSSSVVKNINNSVIGYGFNDNKINGLWNCGISSYFQEVDCNASLSNVNFMGATHVYATYNKTIFKNSAGVAKLSYYNSSDVLTVVLPTA